MSVACVVQLCDADRKTVQVMVRCVRLPDSGSCYKMNDA